MDLILGWSPQIKLGWFGSFLLVLEGTMTWLVLGISVKAGLVYYSQATIHHRFCNPHCYSRYCRCSKYCATATTKILNFLIRIVHSVDFTQSKIVLIMRSMSGIIAYFPHTQQSETKNKEHCLSYWIICKEHLTWLLFDNTRWGDEIARIHGRHMNVEDDCGQTNQMAFVAPDEAPQIAYWCWLQWPC